MASTKTLPAALSHFAVFCPALGPDEDSTHEQLLFYSAAALPAFYPYSANDYYARTTHLRRRSSGGSGSGGGSSSLATSTQPVKTGAGGGGERVVSLDMKLREIGLAAALVAFGTSFSGKTPGQRRQRFHVVHSEKRRTVVFEAECGVLLQLSMVLPRRIRAVPGTKDAYSIEFLSTEVSDQAVRAWVESEYWAFRLLHGPLTRALLAGDQQGRRLVRRQLDAFYGRTMAHWDDRWATELDLIHALAPLPRLPIGSISLGGFDQLWRDLADLATPPVAAAVVLWRGQEIVWHAGCQGEEEEDDDDESIHVMRALVAWS
ncbi:hypothetical protein IWW38_006179, partial [Coemansia aciculifera]